MNKVCINNYGNLIPFKSNEEFLKALSSAFEEDYGVLVSKPQLEEAGRNLNSWLQNML